MKPIKAIHDFGPRVGEYVRAGGEGGGMSAKVKRYEQGSVGMRPDPKGAWVSYRSYASLRARLAEAEDTIRAIQSARSITSERANKAEAENAALLKDAERYRFLRGNVAQHSERWMRWELRRWDGRSWHSLEGTTLDAVVDLALAAGERP